MIREQQGETLSAWCNARTSAAGYYEKIGFVIASDEFELPDIGPHVLMVRLPSLTGPLHLEK